MFRNVIMRRARIRPLTKVRPGSVSPPIHRKRRPRGIALVKLNPECAKDSEVYFRENLLPRYIKLAATCGLYLSCINTAVAAS
jgi:hypothetical protein